MNVEVIPYSTFEERLRIVKEELKKDRYIEVWDSHIYSASKRGSDIEDKQECI